MPSFDESIQKTFGGSVELFKEVAEVFLKTYPEYLLQIEQATQEKNFVLLEHAAHSLKGALLPFGFEACASKVFLLEKVSREKAFTGNESAQVSDLKKDLKEVQHLLQVFLAT